MDERLLVNENLSPGSPGAKVVTRDRGRQMDGGFGRNAIQIISKINSFAAILRIITGK
ncbi:hypothetical protein ACIBI9_59765 [Nonomuraea sp. NPDC050451]|uniref:hypothetical protein n=1 Tax=Nonomuraea sp. NPDC050451 TaxID=3364364 RepID=UPI00378914FC